MSSNFLSDSDYDFIYSRSPRLCVDLLLVDGFGQVLLSKRTIEPYINHWHLPGGRVRFRESINDALARICKHELGADISVFGEPFLIGFIEYPDEVQNNQPRHSVSLVYKYTVSQDVFINASDECIFTLNVPDMTIPPLKSFLKSNKIL